MALKEDGVFCITDFRPKGELAEFREDLESADLKIVDHRDITMNIVKSLKLDEQRKIDLIENMVGTRTFSSTHPSHPTDHEKIQRSRGVENKSGIQGQVRRWTRVRDLRSQARWGEE